MLKGRAWLISPVTFFELSLTRDGELRDELIGFAKHLLHKDMLPSVEEIVVQFMDKGCPLFDSIEGFQFNNPISRAWAKITTETKLTYSLNQKMIQSFAQSMREIASLSKKIIMKKTISSNHFNQADRMQIIATQIRKKLPRRKPVDGVSPDVLQDLEVLTIFYIYHFLCLENCMFPSVYNEFWSRFGISDPDCRLGYLVKNHIHIFLRGPFIEMALCAIYQIKNGISRGLTFDDMDFVYLPFVKYFFTNDNHFYGNGFVQHPNIYKIRQIRDMQPIERKFNIEYPLI